MIPIEGNLVKYTQFIDTSSFHKYKFRQNYYKFIQLLVKKWPKSDHDFLFYDDC